MKVTQEMIDAFNGADFSACGNADWEDSHIRAGLRAVLDMIDPIPDHVNRVVDRDGDTWRRVSTDHLLWRCEAEQLVVVNSVCRLSARYGPLTWEEKG